MKVHKTMKHGGDKGKLVFLAHKIWFLCGYVQANKIRLKSQTSNFQPFIITISLRLVEAL